MLAWGLLTSGCDSFVCCNWSLMYRGWTEMKRVLIYFRFQRWHLRNLNYHQYFHPELTNLLVSKQESVLNNIEWKIDIFFAFPIFSFTSFFLFSITDPACSDQYHNCMLVVQAQLCIYSYYKSVCCASCSRTQKTYHNSFQKNHIHRWFYHFKDQFQLKKMNSIVSASVCVNIEHGLIFCHCIRLTHHSRNIVLRVRTCFIWHQTE